MALHFSNACCFSALSRGAVGAVRGVAFDHGSVAVKRGEMEKVNLGGSELQVTRIGIGSWSWGDASYWNNFQWDDRKLKAAKAAFEASIDSGITFFDTAEVYGFLMALGAISSETLLGRFIKERKQRCQDLEVAVATKFSVFGWRLGRHSVVSALKDSLSRLQLSPAIWGDEGYIDGLADAVEQEKRLRAAHHRLMTRGVPLASNQVNYSLVYRLPEENGVKPACDELGITLIAYSPLAQGVLTGKYSPENTPSGIRGKIYTSEFLKKLQPLMNRVKEIGESYDKTPTQVVLNWLIAQENVVPVVGARNAEQAKEFAGAAGWRLSNQEVDELRSISVFNIPLIIYC